MANQHTPSKGYYFNPKKNRYIARLTVDGKRKQLGSFKTEEEAADFISLYRIGYKPVLFSNETNFEFVDLNALMKPRRFVWLHELKAKVFRRKLEREMDEALANRINKL